ncbi:TPA: beta-phosphoglucomutase [Enterococcus faecalis]|jgi:beta-phosphoglucomutase|uniref:beta-phosphoglucomutase n=1 Tax=Enterococcus TaxID=1350 RepID=UPI0001B2B855|nr:MULTISPECIES: beta-phosphoglucomutase [Enterococcus]ETJ09568.1 MAG: Beta-phosphoglucomutase [Enterococcus faecalis DORA_14]HAP3747043.1 beta-phosphoglucomutase [Enterococcus faecalis TDR28]HAP3752411.1 beta-phosphoglucomutase [Enterococcus faecalis TDR22]HAP3755065.1 beta-phosphoglucomutase [Enterococcus faecalis TDR13]HAP3758277.1 beta-phosphoglucomutase [Enterococcus faecalis TDR7]HAP3769605.1 beta-phosphoglucomutase [Enterococcus faecalis TDR19]HAP4962721.1 beta-phosphoglucomutase [Ent
MTIGFIFDLDGVITDTAKFHYQAWKALADSLGIPIDETFNETLKGISRMDSLDRILAHGHRENAFTPAEKEALAQQKNDHYVQLLEHLTTEDVLPGVVPLLQQAQARHIPCAVASASKNAPLILEKLGVRAYFATIVDPDSLSKGKPDPEIFLAAANSIGVLPQNAIGFEDAQSGIDGLKAAGIYAVGLSASQPLIGADMQVSEMTELSVDALLNR